MQQIHTKGDNGNNYLTRIYGCKNNIKYDQQLYHRWGATDHSQINTTDHIKDLKLTCLIMCRTDNSNDKSQKIPRSTAKKVMMMVFFRPDKMNCQRLSSRKLN